MSESITDLDTVVHNDGNREDDREPAEFGITGVIGLASELAMSIHGATINTMRASPQLAFAASKTQAAILEEFDAFQPWSTWNDLPTDTAIGLFENFAKSYRGEN
jgi:hypothetical protein